MSALGGEADQDRRKADVGAPNAMPCLGAQASSKIPKCYISGKPSYSDAKLAETLAFSRPASAETAPENHLMLAYDETITFPGAAFHKLKTL
jgi:hypothetical protein